MLIISNNFLVGNVKDLIKGKFGNTTGQEIIDAVESCIKAAPKMGGIQLIDCAVKKLTYSATVKQEVWDYLYQYVIVG